MYDYVPPLQGITTQISINALTPLIAGQAPFAGMWRGGWIPPTRQGLSDAIESLITNDGLFHDDEHYWQRYALPSWEQTVIEFDPAQEPLVRFIYIYSAPNDEGSPVFVKYRGTDALIGNQLWTGPYRTTPPLFDLPDMVDFTAYDCTFSVEINIPHDEANVFFTQCIFDPGALVFAHNVTIQDCTVPDGVMRYVDHLTIINTDLTVPEPGTLAIAVGGLLMMGRNSHKKR